MNGNEVQELRKCTDCKYYTEKGRCTNPSLLEGIYTSDTYPEFIPPANFGCALFDLNVKKALHRYISLVMSAEEALEVYKEWYGNT